MDRRRFLLGSAALPALGVASTRGDAFAGLPDGPPEDPHDETYWHALRANGIQDRLMGFGRLMSEF